MDNHNIEIRLFFENANIFPWDVISTGVPKYGLPHSYVCSMLAPFANRYEKPLLLGNPSMREIGRLAKILQDAQSSGQIELGDHETKFVTPVLFTHFSNLYEKSNRDRTDVGQEVLDSLRNFDFYMKFMEDRLMFLWRQKLINIPMKYLRLKKTEVHTTGWIKK